MLAAAAGIAAALLPTVTAAAASTGTVVVVVGEAAGSYATGFCADPGQPVLFSTTCSDAQPVVGLQLVSGGGTYSVSLPEGSYSAAMADTGAVALSAIGAVDVVAGQTIRCTFTMAGGPTCVPDAASTGTVVVVVGEATGSYATGFCADPGQPVLFSTTCSDGRQVLGLQFVAGGATYSVSLPEGSYSAAMADVGGHALSPIGQVGLAAGQTITCTFTMTAPPSCDDGDGDGVVEPVGADGNGDGIPDSEQASVATFDSATGGVLTIAAPDESYAVSAVVSSGPPYSPAPPEDATLPVGVLGFNVILPPAATSADVVLFLPPGSNPTSYFKLRDGAWVDFSDHAAFAGDSVTLHLEDGDEFDQDGVQDGVIEDPGFPSSGYRFTGFHAPIDAAATNSSKAGQTVPVRWRLTDAAGAPTADPTTFVSATSQGALCAGGAVDAVEVFAPGRSGLEYLGNGEWQLNWKTSKTFKGQCRTLVVTLSDGTQHTAAFVFT